MLEFTKALEKSAEQAEGLASLWISEEKLKEKGARPIDQKLFDKLISFPS